jgi:hypothetical protein
MKRLAAFIALAAALLCPAARAQTNGFDVAAFGLYDAGTRQIGAGVLAIYNATPYVGAGVGFYYFPRPVTVAMPSANFQLKYPLTLGPVTITPWMGTGAATGLYGSGSGSAVGLAYGGIAVDTPVKTLDLTLGVVKATTERSPWLVAGLVWRL